MLRPAVSKAMHCTHASGGRGLQLAGTAGARALRQERGWVAQNQPGQCNWSEVRGGGKVGVRLDEARGHPDLDGETRVVDHEESGLYSDEMGGHAARRHDRAAGRRGL